MTVLRVIKFFLLEHLLLKLKETFDCVKPEFFHLFLALALAILATNLTNLVDQFIELHHVFVAALWVLKLDVFLNSNRMNKLMDT